MTSGSSACSVFDQSALELARRSPRSPAKASSFGPVHWAPMRAFAGKADGVAIATWISTDSPSSSCQDFAHDSAEATDADSGKVPGADSALEAAKAAHPAAAKNSIEGAITAGRTVIQRVLNTVISVPGGILSQPCCASSESGETRTTHGTDGAMNCNHRVIDAEDLGERSSTRGEQSSPGWPTRCGFLLTHARRPTHLRPSGVHRNAA